ncbi:MAG: hypothetical protein HYY98_16960 [Burkholderiales bacterium]|nr:hypothetical protein [Burkholderiales bacterium]
MHHPNPSAHACTQPAPGAAQATATKAINTPTLNPGEHYAGPVLDESGQLKHHLVLLPARPERHLNWDDAMAWADGIGAQLPDRQEQALLFANCRDALSEEWCWSRQEDEEDASFAWGCHFGDGYQVNNHKSFEGSAVAVRRLPLESFNSFASSPTSAHACAHPALTKAEVSNIRKRLDRWELDHLRKLVQEQADRLETAQERIDALESEARRAWDVAESWRMDAMELVNDLEDAGKTVGLTKSGQLLVMTQEGGAA